MKNYGSGGEVNERLDTLDVDLALEKLWNKTGTEITMQTDVNGPITGINLEGRHIAEVVPREDQGTDVANVAYAKKKAILYGLIF